MQPVKARRQLRHEILLNERLTMVDNEGVWTEFVTREAV
jgi:hypothetical protein